MFGDGDPNQGIEEERWKLVIFEHSICLLLLTFYISSLVVVVAISFFPCQSHISFRFFYSKLFPLLSGMLYLHFSLCVSFQKEQFSEAIITYQTKKKKRGYN